jgi:hypothetical protein
MPKIQAFYPAGDGAPLRVASAAGPRTTCTGSIGTGTAGRASGCRERTGAGPEGRPDDPLRRPRTRDAVSGEKKKVSGTFSKKTRNGVRNLFWVVPMG